MDTSKYRRDRLGSVAGPVFVAGLISLLILSLSFPGQLRAETEPLQRIPDALIEPGPGPDRLMLVVEKASQKVFFFEFKKGDYYLLETFSCTTGANTGDKLKRGDEKTPEGFYQFVEKKLEDDLPDRYGILAYPMDYPNFWDIRLGKTGSGIWMHGTNKALIDHDSEGCINLNNIDILDLEHRVRLYDTPIIIYNRINYLSLKEINLQAARIKAFVERWRRAWAEKDFHTYRSCYAPNFTNSDGRSYREWMDHKSRLNDLYGRIRVDLENLRIFRHQGLIVVLFDQYYQGDGFKSNGAKRLYLREKGGGYVIEAEVWKEFPPKRAVPFLSAEVRERVVRQAQMQAAAKPQPPAAPADAEAKVVRGAVDEWLGAWRSKDMLRFLALYHPDFKFKDMNRDEYGEYKRGLASKYKKISIGVDDLKIEVDGDQAVVTYIQDYHSDKYQDYGLKTLVFRKVGADWRIFEESWKELGAGAKP